MNTFQRTKNMHSVAYRLSGGPSHSTQCNTVIQSRKATINENFIFFFNFQ